MAKSYTLKLGDCHAIMDQLHENSVDAIVTDPPYEINFMAKTWDNAGVAFNPTTWEKAVRVLKPGGHMLVFGHSRKMHRIIVAIEDAGFEIRDTLMWLYGSGFPKSHNIGKAVDTLQGNKRDNLKHRTFGGRSGNAPTTGASNGGVSGGFNYKDDRTLTKGNTKWEGWGTALKPAYEPIVLARKPFKGSIADNVLEHGTGGINIDECRVGNEERTIPIHSNDLKTDNTIWKLHPTIQHERVSVNQGRFPANVIHDGSDEVTSGFPDTSPSKKAQRGSGINGNTFLSPEYESTSRGHDDNGGNASRFFYTAKASKKDRDEGLGKLNMGKVGHGNFGNSKGFERFDTGGRNTHPTVKPTDLMQYLVRLITPKGGTVLDPFMGSGSTGKATMIENNERNANYHFIGIDLAEEYMEIAKARIEYGVHYFENKEKEVQNVDENQTTLFDWE